MSPLNDSNFEPAAPGRVAHVRPWLDRGLSPSPSPTYTWQGWPRWGRRQPSRRAGDESLQRPSSNYTAQPSKLHTTMCINRPKVTGAFINPNGVALCESRPDGVIKVDILRTPRVNGACQRIWQKQVGKHRLVESFPPLLTLFVYISGSQRKRLFIFFCAHASLYYANSAATFEPMLEPIHIA